MNLLALPRYGDQGASSRVRLRQYGPWLAAAGIEMVSAPFFGDRYLQQQYQGRRALGEVGSAYLRRVVDLVSAAKPNLIWVEKEALPWLPWVLERKMLPRRVPLVSDYDDAVFHNYDLHPSPLVRRVLGRKIDGVMRASSLVLAGNAYLASRARLAGARRVEVVPTVVDVSEYRPKTTVEEIVRPPTIGWIGTPSTWRAYMDPILPVLLEVAEAARARLLAVGAAKASPPDPIVRQQSWSEETEVSSIQAMDVGIMPLIDTPWAQGKCGYKLIQYMACGLPVVASPVGVNCEIITHGVNGFLAADARGWREALTRLIRDPELRRRMGAAGRAKVEREYSLQTWGPRVADLMAATARTSGARN